MKKLLACLTIVLGLTACSTLPTLNLSNQVNLNTLEGVVSGYGLVVNAELALKGVPLCKTNTNPSATNICVKRSVIVRLQNVDKIANTAVNQAVAFVKNNPTVDPSGYIATAQQALLAAQVVVNSAKGN